jgi:hypothetical protein
VVPVQAAPPRPARRRVFSEEVPFELLASARVLRLLAERDLGLCFAVRPDTLQLASAVVQACREGGVSVGVWPMLRDEDGRFAHVRNLLLFHDFTARLLDALGDAGTLPDDVLVDLEPSIDPLRSLVLHGAGALRHLPLAEVPSGPSFAEGSRRLQELARFVSGLGVSVSFAVVPLLLWGERGPTWERLLGTPLPEGSADRVEGMLYTSMIEGWSAGALSRRDAEALLVRGAEATRRRFGERAGVALGAVGPGALRSEPTYRGPDELARDVALALGAGVTSLSLFDLGGVLAREPAEAWLDAFATTAPRISAAPGLRARAALGAMDMVATVLGRVVG